MNASHHAPPFSLVWRHFAVALLTFPMALAALAWAAPAVVANPRGPEALAIVHGFAIGWIALVVMGALTQMIPVVLAVPLASHKAIAGSHALTALGAVAMTVGFATGAPLALMAGGSAVAAGFAIFVATLAVTLRGVKKWDMTAVAVAGALGLMVTGGLLGALMAANQRWVFWPALFGAMPAHAHLLTVGWLTALTAGVSYKLLPMFSLAYGHPLTSGRWALGLLLGGGALWLVTVPVPGAWPLPAALQGLGALLYAWDAQRLLARRKKRRLETGLGMAARAIALLPVVVAVGAAAAIGVPGAAGAYGVLLLVGWIGWTLVGYLYKIVPFLVWVQRFSSPASAGKRPLATELVDARLARLAGDALTIGTIGMAVGFLGNHAGGVRLAAAMAAAGAFVAAYDLFQSQHRKGATRSWKTPFSTPSKASSTPNSASASSISG